MDILKDILRKIHTSAALLPKEIKKLWVAVSGGRDSVFLLDCLHMLQKKGMFTPALALLHIDHALRGKESKKDLEFVRHLAQEYGLPFSSHSLSWEEKELRSQERFRKKRYEIFQQYITPKTALALGQHMDDQAETVLQRLIRGTGLRGLACMREWDGKGLWRPLLGVESFQIGLAAKKLFWREDSSNRSLKYERNWLRYEIFPLLEKHRPGCVRRFASLAKEVSQLSFTFQPVECISLEDSFALYSQKELFPKSSYELMDCFQCERKQLSSLQELLGKSSGSLSLPGKAICQLSQGWLLYSKKGKELSFPSSPLHSEWKSVWGTWKGEGVLGENSILRSRQKGDGTRIKRRLHKAKIPSFLRSAVPICEKGKEKTLLLPPNMGKAHSWELDMGRVFYAPGNLARRLSAGS